MRLDEYLHRENLRPSQFARLANVRPSTIARILNGDRRPRTDTVAKVSVASGGAVTPNDFLDAELKTEDVA
jgi:predicted transcriptional regulator